LGIFADIRRPSLKIPLGIDIIDTKGIRRILMKKGQTIKLRGYGGEELVRCLVRLDKDTVVVCRPEEYESARLEGREPVTVGFHINDVIGGLPPFYPVEDSEPFEDHSLEDLEYDVKKAGKDKKRQKRYEHSRK
jgi:hypothetical protein